MEREYAHCLRHDGRAVSKDRSRLDSAGRAARPTIEGGRDTQHYNLVVRTTMRLPEVSPLPRGLRKSVKIRSRNPFWRNPPPRRRRPRQLDRLEYEFSLECKGIPIALSERACLYCAEKSELLVNNRFAYVFVSRAQRGAHLAE
jgi:hypothetical protein